MNTKHTLKHVVTALLLLILFSCEDTTIINNYTGTGEEKTYSIEGYAQKGPFIVGSAVTISELNEDLFPTGKVFFSTILTQQGYFELPGVVLQSPYVQIKVEGRYFGEATGGIQGDQLILYSIADIRELETVNVNIITHLIKSRVEHLVQENDLSFSAAKDQALEDLLSVFNWEDIDVENPEELNISDDGDGAAVLLALSVIIDNISDATVRLKTITDFQYDFKDGDIDSDRTKIVLVTSAEIVNREYVLDNLDYFFGTSNYADFSEPLDTFIENTTTKSFYELLMPEEVNSKINLCAAEGMNLTNADNYRVAIKLPDSLKIHLITSIQVYPSEAGNTFDAPSAAWKTVEFHPESPTFCPWGEPCEYKIFYLETTESSNDIIIPISFSGHGKFDLRVIATIENCLYRDKTITYTW